MITKEEQERLVFWIELHYMLFPWMIIVHGIERRLGIDPWKGLHA